MESTKTFILRETNIPQQFAMMVSQEVTVVFRDGSQHPATVYNGNDLSTQVNECVDIFSTFIGTCADTLSSPEMKPEEGKAAIVFQNTKGIGEMLLAVVSEYIEEEGEGNWYYSFTFNPDDIKGIDPKNIHNFSDQECTFTFKYTKDGEVKTAPTTFCNHFQKFFAVSANKWLGSDAQVAQQLILIIVRCIRDWLDAAATEENRVELVIDGITRVQENITIDEYNRNKFPFATAAVEVVKDIKKFSMNFSEELKQVCKGDSDTLVPVTGEI